MSATELQQVKQRVVEVRALLHDREEALRQNPNDFGKELALSSLRSHLEDLNRQVILLEAQETRELINFRLIGNQVSDGTITLGLLAKLAGPLAEVLHASAYRLRYNDEDKPEARNHIQKLLDLRLAGLGEGSTRLYLTGNATPDLAGQSLLEDAMKQLFALLNADQEGFFDALHAMGPRAARAAESLLKAMESEEVAAELSWTTPAQQSFVWEGRTDRITMLRSLLEQTEERQTEIVELRGIISLLSDTLRLEIREDGRTKPTKIRYRKEQASLIAGLTVSQRVVVEVEKTSFFNKSEQRTIEHYRLGNIIAA
jgi:hypothetical protein